MTDINPLTQLQRRRNAQTAANWNLAESHRRQVTRLIVEQKNDAAPQLCILGAGNCLDIDLVQLHAHFEQIDLADIDGAALTRGIAAQNCQQDESLRLHGDCDVTGVWQLLAQLCDATDSDIDRLIADSQSWPGLPDLGPSGTVVSVCLLSQLVEGVISTLGEAHPRCLEVIAAVRQRHLRLLCELTTAGGNAILITDFVSSDTAPTLPGLAGKALSDTLMHMIKHHNFFTGLNPFRLQMLLNEDPVFAGKIDSMNCQEPWLWNFGPRHYAVTAISFRKL